MALQCCYSVVLLELGQFLHLCVFNPARYAKESSLVAEKDFVSIEMGGAIYVRIQAKIH